MSGWSCSRIQRYPEGIIPVIGSENPARISVNDLVASQHELRKDLIAIGVVGRFSRIVAFEFVVVVLVEAIPPTLGARLRESVGCFLFVLAEDDQLGPAPVLPGLPDIAPESGLFHVVAATIEEVPARLGSDLGLSLGSGRPAHGSTSERSPTLAEKCG